MLTIILLLFMGFLFVSFKEIKHIKTTPHPDQWAINIITNTINGHFGRETALDVIITPVGSLFEDPIYDTPNNNLLSIDVLALINGHTETFTVLIDELTNGNVKEATNSIMKKIEAYQERLTLPGC